MKQITIKRVSNIPCPQCKEGDGYFQVEEGITWYHCPICRYSIRAKHYSDKIKEQK